MQHQFNPDILRSYDIRGIVGSTLAPTDAFAIGLGFASLARKTKGARIVIGRDGRISSPELSQALADGLMHGGVDVIDIGLSATPMLYFADLHFEADGAIQITGSHNPGQHNGFKMVLQHSPFFGEAIQKLGASLAKGVAQSDTIGTIKEVDINAIYVAMLKDKIGKLDNIGDMTFVWDCGNGATGPVINAITDEICGAHHVLFAEVDGNFPNHHPDPSSAETLDLLRQNVAEKNAVLGIGFDGDGDRIGLIDAKGRHIPGDLITAYLARPVCRKHADAEVIFDIKSSLIALDAITAMGGNPSLWKTGHSHMKIKLKESTALIAGEMSGHIFIADDYYGFDDAIFAALLILREMAQSGESITDFMDTLPPCFATPELRIACADDKKFDIVERIVSNVKAHPDPDQTAFIDIDGIRVSSAAGWWLIRASNTDAQLIVRAEGRDEDGCAMLKERVRKRLADVGLNWEG